MTMADKKDVTSWMNQSKYYPKILEASLSPDTFSVQIQPISAERLVDLGVPDYISSQITKSDSRVRIIEESAASPKPNRYIVMRTIETRTHGP